MDESGGFQPSQNSTTRAFRLAGFPAGIALALAFACAAVLLATSAGAAAPQASWRGSNPKVGQVTALVRSKTRLYAGNSVGGVFRSDDGGLTWLAVRPSGGSQSILSLAVDPANPDRLWTASYTEGVWSTANGGKTWTRTELCANPSATDSDPATWCDPSPDGVMAVAVDPANSSILYAADMGGVGLYKSTNRGATWAVASSNWQAITGNNNYGKSTLFIDPKKPNIVLLGIPTAGIFRSTNGGQTFTKATQGIPTLLQTAAPGGYVYDPVTKNVLIGIDAGAVYRSTNDGASWVPSSKGLPANSYSIGGTLAQSPVNPKLLVIYGPGEALWGSADGGHSWKVLSTTGFCCATAYAGGADAVVFDGHNARTIYWGSLAKGVFRTVNGAGLPG